MWLSYGNWPILFKNGQFIRNSEMTNEVKQCLNYDSRYHYILYNSN